MYIIELLGIFILAVFSLWTAGIAGMSLGLDPFTLVFTLVAGYAFSVILLVIVGAPLRERVLKKFTFKPEGTVSRIINRYGMVGLALVAPLLTGALIGTAVGLTLRMPPRRLFVWMTAGAAVWSILLIAPMLVG
jgi:uncharacterized membrane protein